MPRTICNPVQISYAYQKYYHGRESADPAVVLFEGAFYLFASHGHGYWTSENLADWEYIPVDTERFPQFKLFAPAVCAVGKTLYIAHSEYGTVLKTDNPRDPESWVDIGKAFDWADPAFWADDDGYVYVYEGCSDVAPIRVAKLDPRNDMKLVEGPVACAFSDKEHRGFERSGENNEDDLRKPYFEGAWMNKIGKKYYLTYAVPGTEFPVYADGCFVGDSPMGPFEYCDNSPVNFKNTGFLRGCGHGCLFEDKKGRLWKMDTVAISVNHMFERRLALFPAKIGCDGKLYANTEFMDMPIYVPTENENPFDCPGPDWRVISRNASCKASSSLTGHEPGNASVEDARLWWSGETGNPGEWIELDLGEEKDAVALQIALADQDIEDCWGRNHGFGYHFTIEVSSDGKNYTLIDEVENKEPLDYSYQYYDFEGKRRFRFVRLTNLGKIPAGGRFAVSGIRVFGENVPCFKIPSDNISVERLDDDRSAIVSWIPAEGAAGYTVRFGVHPQELHTHMRIYGDCRCRVNCLNSGAEYYFEVEAFY